MRQKLFMTLNAPPHNYKFWIAGAGKSGISCALLLQKKGYFVFVSNQGLIQENTKFILQENKISFEEEHNFANLSDNFQAIVLSPGITLNSEIAKFAFLQRIPILSEIEVCSWFLKDTDYVVGITGTNGKSTTTHYLNQLIQCSKMFSECYEAGNIGTPFSEVLLNSENSNSRFFALELSSYQLESTYSSFLNTSIVLNIQNDHMERYKTLENYIQAKNRITHLTKTGGNVFLEYNFFLKLKIQGLSLPEHRHIYVCHEEQIHSEQESKNIKNNWTNALIQKATTIPTSNYHNFSLTRLYSGYEKLESGKEPTNLLSSKENIYEKIKLELSKEKYPVLRGSHNLQNACFASASAALAGAPEALIVSFWNAHFSEYKILPHRLEILKQTEFGDKFNHKTIIICNDSKATNVESTLVALNSFTQNVILLCGGLPKGDHYAPIKRYFNATLKKVIPFGKAGSMIYEELCTLGKPCKTLHKPLPTLKEACEAAFLEASQQNDVILLSPACSSFDEFLNFEHRGDFFKEFFLQKSLKKKE
jgi:UDP-N-acetylmuramoylalanine--D-glutamate ligase